MSVGYRLSPRAAEAEARSAASRGQALTLKDVSYLDGIPILGRSDGDNFVTNRITTESLDDQGAVGRGLAVGLSATWACVSFWAGNIASLPMTVYRTGPHGLPVEDRSHRLYRLLHTSPNYDQSAFDFWEFMVGSIELRGNAYAEKRFRADGSILSLEPILPDSVTVKRVNGRIWYRWTDQAGEHLEPQENVFHVRGFGGGSLGGVSPLAACRQSFSSAAATERAASTIFKNGVRASGVMQVKQSLNPEQRALLEELLTEKFVGALNVGKPMVLDNDATWQALTINPIDAEMLETRRFGVEDVCRIFEVDPHLVGQTQGNTSLGSSIKDQTQSVLKFKMRKRLKRIEGAAEQQLLTAADVAAGISLKFNVEAFLRADSSGRAEFYDLMKPFMTINQVRALEGWEPVPGGDVVMVQMQDVQLGRKPKEPKA